MLTQEQFVEAGGVLCPNCGQEDIQLPLCDARIVDRHVKQKVGCMACGASWWEVHSRILTGFEGVELEDTSR